MKNCFKCDLTKPLSDFYKHAQMTDGHLGKCKVCTRKDVKDRADIKMLYPDFVESERERHREKYHRLGYKEKHKPSYEGKKKSMDKYYAKYPEKYEAKKASQRVKLSNSSNNLHHWSYNEQHYKCVIEMPIPEHYLLHRFLIYDAETKMYKDIEGNILDTRAKHINYMNIVTSINSLNEPLINRT